MQRLLLILLIAWLVAGCAPKGTFVLMPDPGGEVGEIIVSNAQGTQVLNAAQQSVAVKSKNDRPGEAKTMNEREIRSLFGKALDIQPLPPVKFILYFKPESSRPVPGSKSEIARILQVIKERHSADISVNGHTDRMGDADYNYHLSVQRARHVQMLLEQQGVEPKSITTTSHGMNNPLVPTADNVPEPRNRRVEVIVR